VGNLTGKEIVELAELLRTTLSLGDLEIFVQESTGDRLFDEFVSSGKPLKNTIVDLLGRLEELGQTSIFLACVYARRPGRPDVRAEIVKLFPDAIKLSEQKIDLSAQTAGAPQIDAPTNAIVPGLQRNVRPNLAQLDINAWQSRLMQVKSQVCRMELEQGHFISTGFLVGPDTVLTTWHFFENAKGKDYRLNCRFDYERLADGTTQPGRLVRVQSDGCIDFSPYSATEMITPDNPLPTPEELDYALLRLTDRIGEEQVNGAARGWIKLPNAVSPLPADTPILIVQHPEGMPIKLAMDTEAVIGLNANGTRIRYRTITEAGSAGSPVFTMDWDIVAMHHASDPNWSNPMYRQGVPIELIRQRIERNGFGAALGA
jgi:hypothetical protein